MGANQTDQSQTTDRDAAAKIIVLKMVEAEALRIGMPPAEAAALAKECENDPLKANRILGLAPRGFGL